MNAYYTHRSFSVPFCSIFTMRRYASTVYMLSSCVCLSVQLSVTSQYCIKTTGRIKLAFCMETSFHLSHFDTSENKGTSLWNFVPNSGLRKFHHGKSPASSTKLVVDSWACWQHLYDSMSCGCLLQVLTQPSNSITSICYGSVAQLVSTVDKILTHIAYRVVCLW